MALATTAADPSTAIAAGAAAAADELAALSLQDFDEDDDEEDADDLDANQPAKPASTSVGASSTVVGEGEGDESDVDGFENIGWDGLEVTRGTIIVGGSNPLGKAEVRERVSG